MSGTNACLEALLARGASVTKQLPDGSTPLHTAAIGGDQRTVDLLCKAGGSIAALNNEKRTPTPQLRHHRQRQGCSGADSARSSG